MDWAAPFFHASSLQAQQALLDAHRDRVDRGLFWWRLFCHPLVVYALAQDPSFLRSTDGSVGAYLVRRLIGYASSNLVRESYLLRLVYDCGLAPASPLPLYLSTEGFDLARKNLASLEIQCADLRDFGARCSVASSVKWSLSDVSCWMGERQFHELIRFITYGMLPGSRFCARNFAARRDIPRDLLGRLRRRNDLCRLLDSRDASVIYRFEVGEAVPPQS